MIIRQYVLLFQAACMAYVAAVRSMVAECDPLTEKCKYQTIKQSKFGILFWQAHVKQICNEAGVKCYEVTTRDASSNRNSSKYLFQRYTKDKESLMLSARNTWNGYKNCKNDMRFPLDFDASVKSVGTFKKAFYKGFILPGVDGSLLDWHRKVTAEELATCRGVLWTRCVEFLKCLWDGGQQYIDFNALSVFFKNIPGEPCPQWLFDKSPEPLQVKGDLTSTFVTLGTVNFANLVNFQKKYVGPGKKIDILDNLTTVPDFHTKTYVVTGKEQFLHLMMGIGPMTCKTGNIEGLDEQGLLKYMRYVWELGPSDMPSVQDFVLPACKE